MTDVATYEGRIAIIGDCSDRDAHEIVDCTGMALAPGFIDVHSHSDELWLIDGRALGKISQGVTTEIAGNCGTSVAPLHGEARIRKVRDARTYKLDVDWTTFDEFFGAVERSGVACNVASLVGLGTTRSCISGVSDRRLEREELDAQTRLVREAVEHGALGVSSGLIYEPSRYADLAELTACAAVAREAGAARYVSHVRNEGDELIESDRRKRWRSVVKVRASRCAARITKRRAGATGARSTARWRRSTKRATAVPTSRSMRIRTSRAGPNSPRSCPTPCGAAEKRR